MKPIILSAMALSLCLSASFADAQGNSGKAKGHQGKGHGKGDVVQIQPVPQAKSCPPGLANKGCVPPGQAKKYGIGDIIPTYTRIQKPGHWAKPGGHYVQAGGYVYQVDETTHKVLTLVGAAADLIN